MRLIRFFQGFDFLGIQLYLQSLDRVIQVMWFSGADDWGGNAGLVQHPSERNLRVGHVSFFAQSSDAVDDLKIGVLVVKTVRKTIGFSSGCFPFLLGVAISSQKASG